MGDITGTFYVCKLRRTLLTTETGNGINRIPEVYELFQTEIFFCRIDHFEICFGDYTFS